jgi:hypothetical protein
MERKPLAYRAACALHNWLEPIVVRLGQYCDRIERKEFENANWAAIAKGIPAAPNRED